MNEKDTISISPFAFSVNHMKDKICIITGSSSGVGRATALGLAKLGARIIMVCHNRKRGEEALSFIKEKSRNKKIELMVADLSIQDSIRQFVDEFKKAYEELHVLSNNAGIISFERHLTRDGIEMTFAVDYLSHFLLTSLLLDILKKSVPSRIITVSGGMRILRRGTIRFDDIQFEKKFNGIKAAVQAALARFIFTYELAKRLRGSGVTANTFHPGFVKSNLARNFPWYGRLLFGMIQPFLTDECKTSVYLASSPEKEGVSGKYFVNLKEVDFTPKRYDESTAERLWTLSEELTGIHYDCRQNELSDQNNT